MTDQPSLLRRLAGAAASGLRLLAVGLAALALAVVAAVTTVVGAAARLVAAMLGELARLVQAALPWLLGAIPWLTRGARVLATGASMVAAYPYLWDGYAGDTGSVIVGGAIAAGVVVAPIAWAALSGKWAFLLGAITGIWSVWLLAPLSVVTVSDIFNGRKNDARGQHETLENVGQAPADGGDGLHDLVGASAPDGG